MDILVRPRGRTRMSILLPTAWGFSSGAASWQPAVTSNRVRPTGRPTELPAPAAPPTPAAIRAVIGRAVPGRTVGPVVRPAVIAVVHVGAVYRRVIVRVGRVGVAGVIIAGVKSGADGNDRLGLRLLGHGRKRQR